MCLIPTKPATSGVVHVHFICSPQCEVRVLFKSIASHTSASHRRAPHQRLTSCPRRRRGARKVIVLVAANAQPARSQDHSFERRVFVSRLFLKFCTRASHECHGKDWWKKDKHTFEAHAKPFAFKECLAGGLSLSKKKNLRRPPRSKNARWGVTKILSRSLHDAANL